MNLRIYEEIPQNKPMICIRNIEESTKSSIQESSLYPKSEKAAVAIV